MCLLRRSVYCSTCDEEDGVILVCQIWCMYNVYYSIHRDVVRKINEM